MIVIGVDTHKRNHTLVAVDGQTGALAGQRAIVANDAGSLDALRFAAGLAAEIASVTRDSSSRAQPFL